MYLFFFPKLQDLLRLWIGYGKGKHFSVLPIHEICQQLSPQICEAILFFHAFTGSDLTSSLRDVGKKKAWNVWMSDNVVQQTMTELTKNPQVFSENSFHMQTLEKFTVLLYRKDCFLTTIKGARRQMLTQKLMSLERILPTRAALVQHVKRTLLVSALIWGKCFSRAINLPSPEESSNLDATYDNTTGCSSACSMFLNALAKKLANETLNVLSTL